MLQSLGLAGRGESDWQQLRTEGGYAERDDQAVAAINACFAKDPGCRMLVIRGESHTTPDGYLAARLVHRPLVLSVHMPTFAMIGDGPFVGRTFRIGERGSIYYWGVEDPLEIFPKLVAWLAAH